MHVFFFDCLCPRLAGFCWIWLNLAVAWKAGMAAGRRGRYPPMREMMSRSGVPPKAEVTKSLWSTDPASTKATTPGVSVAGRPLTVGTPSA